MRGNFDARRRLADWGHLKYTGRKDGGGRARVNIVHGDEESRRTGDGREQALRGGPLE